MDNKEAEKTNHVEVNEHAPAKTTLSPADTTEIAQMSLLEHEVGKLQSFREYPWACLWCIYAVWLVLLVSFENQAAGTVFGIPKFREDFGHAYTDENGDTGYVIEGHWQAAFQGAPVATSVIGSLVSGQLADWLGRRMVVMICLVISFAAITMEFVSTSPPLFFGGKLLNGLPVGALVTVAVTYIGEVAPLKLRGLLTCLTALSYTLGPLTVALIVNSTGTYDNRWAYRAVFAAQYGFAVIPTILVPFMPESPWWLASKDRNDKAIKALNQLGHRGVEAEKKLSIITKTLQEIRQETEGVTYFECFRKSNLRRTMISVAPLSIQALSGITFIASYATYYMQLAGYSTEMSFKLQIVQQVISLVGNVMSWYLVDKVGRRNLTFYGLAILTLVLFVMAGTATLETEAGSKASVSMVLIYCWLFNVTIGATAYTLLCEVATSRLRAKTIAIGLALQNTLQTMWSFVLPYLFNPDQLNLGGRLGFIFGALAVVSLVYLWFFQPETKNRSYDELDEMFMKRVPARKFKTYVTEVQQSQDAVREKGMDL
ncbi:hypothetical protein MBLNU230_g1980t1 [Neophaeotheca triangularis]